jgi:cytochrome c oxidase subunit 1
MAMTETRSITEPAAPGLSAPTRPAGVAGLLGTGDHTSLGRVWLGASLLFGLVTLVMLGVWGLQPMGGGDTGVLSDDLAFRVFTTGRLALPLLFVAPLLIGLATVVVPLQVGSRTIAFPRAAAAALWTWVLSSVLFLVATAIGGGIGANTTEAVDLSLISLAGVIIGLLLASLCLFTTVFTLRTPGMDLTRVPFFAWSMVVTAAIWMFTLPVLLGNILLILADHKYGSSIDFGTDANQWQQLSWVVTQPQVFVFAIPALGIVADAVATLARERQTNRGLMMAAVAGFGALGIGAYAQSYFVEGAWGSWVFVGQSAMIVLPLLMLLAGWITSLMNGKTSLTTPVIAGLSAGAGLVLAALFAVPFGLKTLDLWVPVSDLASIPAVESATSGLPIYQMGLGSLVLLAAATAGIGGIFYWGSKISGRTLSEGLGKLAGLLVFLGALLAGLPYLLLGFANKASVLADASDALSGAAIVGTALAAGGVVVAALALLGKGNADTPADPWESGQSLEWLTASPPAPGNFATLDAVESAEPLLDTKEEA